MPIRVLDIFCGAGGSSAGASLAGAEIIGGIDAWNLAADTFGDNFKSARVWNRHLKPNSEPPKVLMEGSVDLLLASPECTNHSPAKGSKPRCEESRATAHYVLNFARTLRPRWIVIENVVQMRTWSGYERMMAGLKRAGYVIKEQKLEAADFGVPQTRRRLFLICDRDREPPDIKPPGCRPRTAEDVVDLRGSWPSKPLYSDRRAGPTIERAERGIRALGKGVPFLIVYYGSDGSGGWQRLDRPLRTLTTLDRFGLVTWEGSEPLLRMLQVDELKRAMGFPPGYRFERGSRRDKIMMLGNGVCPPVMARITEALAHR